MGLGFSKLIFEFCGAVAVGYDLGLFFFFFYGVLWALRWPWVMALGVFWFDLWALICMMGYKILTPAIGWGDESGGGVGGGFAGMMVVGLGLRVWWL